MDDSMMSIENLDDRFDDDDFIGQAMNEANSSIKTDQIVPPKIDVSDLISGSQSTNIPVLFPKCRLDFNDGDTPRNSSSIRDRKRKNFSRRCLSTDLNQENEDSENNGISFQEFRYSKEIKISMESSSSSFFKYPTALSSIENKYNSPKRKNLNVQLELTPEFNTNNTISTKQFKKSKDENDISPRFPLKTSNIFKPNISGGGGGITLQKCFSENHASIMKAVHISSDNRNLIGDCSTSYILPIIPNSKHQDLKSISCHVLADVLNENYTNFIDKYTIIDCRYPYEFKGGHIKTAINLYTQDDILNYFFKDKTKNAETRSSSDKHDILIFHCEFSSERGPSLCRFLRNRDRLKNSLVYPKLHYPELYLLDGGYKEFFAHYSNLCEPSAYLPMLSKNHEVELRRCRSLCKTSNSKHSTQKRNLRL